MLGTNTNLCNLQFNLNKILFETDLLATKFVLAVAAFLIAATSDNSLPVLLFGAYFLAALYSVMIKRENWCSFVVHGIYGAILWSSMVIWEIIHGSYFTSDIALAMAAWWILVRYPLISKQSCRK